MINKILLTLCTKVLLKLIFIILLNAEFSQSVSSPPCFIKQLLRSKTQCPCSTQTFNSFTYNYNDLGGSSQLNGIDVYTFSFWFKFNQINDVESFLFALIPDSTNMNSIDNSFWITQISGQQYFKIDAITQEQFVHTWSGSYNKWIFVAISQRFSVKSIGVYIYEFEGANQLRTLNQNLTAVASFPTQISSNSILYMCSLAYPVILRSSWCGQIHDFKIMTSVYFIELPLQYQDILLHAGPLGKILVNYRMDKNDNIEYNNLFDSSENELHILQNKINPNHQINNFYYSIQQNYYISLHKINLMPGMNGLYSSINFTPEGGFTLGYWFKCDYTNWNYTFSPFQRITKTESLVLIIFHYTDTTSTMYHTKVCLTNLTNCFQYLTQLTSATWHRMVYSIYNTFKINLRSRIIMTYDSQYVSPTDIGTAGFYKEDPSDFSLIGNRQGYLPTGYNQADWYISDFFISYGSILYDTSSSQICVPNCQYVSSFESFRCALCQTGYYQTPQGTCVSSCSLSPGIELIATSLDTCKPKCKEQCSACDNFGQCTSCKGNNRSAPDCECSNNTFNDNLFLQNCESISKSASVFTQSYKLPLNHGLDIGTGTRSFTIDIYFNNTSPQQPTSFVLLGVKKLVFYLGFIIDWNMVVMGFNSEYFTLTVNAYSGTLIQDLEIIYAKVSFNHNFTANVKEMQINNLNSGQPISYSENFSIQYQQTPKAAVFFTGFRIDTTTSKRISFNLMIESINTTMITIQLNTALADPKLTRINFNWLTMPNTSESVSVQHTFTGSNFMYNQISIVGYKTNRVILNQAIPQVIIQTPFYGLNQLDTEKDAYIDVVIEPIKNTYNYLETTSTFSANKVKAYGFFMLIDAIQCTYNNYKCNVCQKRTQDCKSCLGQFRSSIPQCLCDHNYIEDNDRVCQICEPQCNGCYQSRSNCLYCSNNRINQPECICSYTGYYIDQNNQNCIQCNLQICKSCINSNIECVECQTNRQNPPTCQCIEGYYQDVFNNCQQCHYTCRLCINSLSSGCLTCEGNRIGPQSGECLCPSGYESYLFTAQCGSYSKPVVKAIFSSNMSNIYLTFQSDLEVPAFTNLDQLSSKNCLTFFSFQSVQTFGIGYLCNLYPQDTINIDLGQNNTIQIGDSLIINKQVIKIYSVFIDEILNSQVQAPAYMLPPVVQLSGDDKTSFCNDVNIFVSSIKNDGRKGLQIWTWQCSDSSLSELLQNASNTQLYVKIPTYLLNTWSNTIITLSYKTYFGVTGSSNYQINNDFKDNLKLLFTKIDNNPLLQFYSFQLIVIKFKLSDICNQFTSVGIMNSSLSWNQIGGEIIDHKQISIQMDDYKQQAYLYIQPYATKNGHTYQFLINLYEQYTYQSFSSSFQIFIIPSPLLVSFIGGIQIMADYRRDFQIKVKISDPDLFNYAEVYQKSLTYLIDWNCTILNTQQSCQTIEGGYLLSLLMQNQQSFVIPGFTFQEFMAVQFQISVTQFISNIKNEQKQGSANMTVVFGQYSQALLEMQINPEILINSLNLNDQIYLSIQPDIAQQLSQMQDDYDFTAIVSLNYQGRQRGQKILQYHEFKLILWDLFDLSPSSFISQPDEITLNCKLISNKLNINANSGLILKVNQAPTSCILSVDPQIGESSKTIFTLSVSRCQTTSLPLMYRFEIYQNKSDYQSEIVYGTQYQNSLLILNYQSISILTTLLPAGIFNNEVLILVSVQDSQGSLTNLTQVIQVTKSPTQSQNAQSLFQKIENDFQKITQNMWIYILINLENPGQLEYINYWQNLKYYIGGNVQLLEQIMVINILNLDINNIFYTQPSILSVISWDNFIKQNIRTPDHNTLWRESSINIRQFIKIILLELKFVDKYISQIVQNIQCKQLLDNITFSLYNNFIINDQPFIYQGQYISLKIGRTKNNKQILSRILPFTISESLDQYTDYTVFVQNFSINPLRKLTIFKNPDSVLQLIDIGIYANQSKLKININETIYKKNFRISFSLPQQITNVNQLICLSLINDSFITNLCTTTIKKDINSIFCDCLTLDPVTVYNDISGTFKPLQTEVEEDEITIFTVQWTYYPVPLFIAFQTLVWFSLSLWGNYKDDMQSESLLREAKGESIFKQESEPLNEKNQANSPRKNFFNKVNKNGEEEGAGANKNENRNNENEENNTQALQLPKPEAPKPKKLDQFQLLMQQIKEQEQLESHSKQQLQQVSQNQIDETDVFGIYIEEMQTKKQIFNGDIQVVDFRCMLMCTAIFKLNEFYTIFVNYKKKMRRQLRFTILFIRSLVLAILTGIYSEDMEIDLFSILMMAVYCLGFSGFVSFSLFIVRLMLRSNLKPIGTLIIIGGLATTGFFIVKLALHLTIPAHEWSISYGIAIFIDFIIIEIISLQLKVVLFIILFKSGQNWGQFKSFLYLLIYDEDLVKYLTH